MNSLTPQNLKKLLIGFSLSLLIITVFLISKVIFHEDKSINLKTFNVNKQETPQNLPKSSSKEEKSKLMLLPAKN